MNFPLIAAGAGAAVVGSAVGVALAVAWVVACAVAFLVATGFELLVVCVDGDDEADADVLVLVAPIDEPPAMLIELLEPSCGGVIASTAPRPPTVPPAINKARFISYPRFGKSSLRGSIPLYKPINLNYFCERLQNKHRILQLNIHPLKENKKQARPFRPNLLFVNYLLVACCDSRSDFCSAKARCLSLCNLLLNCSLDFFE